MGERHSVDPEHRAHLERSERVWNRWGDYYGKSEEDFGPLLDDAVTRLGVGRGDAVVEVGCGPGVNFERIRERVGPAGSIDAVDYSSEMVDRARERVREHGWDSVEVVQADASRLSLDSGRFDAAFASLSTSVVPDPEAAARVRGAGPRRSLRRRRPPAVSAGTAPGGEPAPGRVLPVVRELEPRRGRDRGAGSGLRRRRRQGDVRGRCVLPGDRREARRRQADA